MNILFLGANWLPIDKEILANLAPYRTEHINRYGDYILNFEQKRRPLNYNIKIL